MQIQDTIPPPACAELTTVPGERQLPLERMLAEADALPLPALPMTNRGALSSTHGVDYLGMTHADTTGRVWCDLSGYPEEEWVELDHGMRHYPCCRSLGSIRVGYGGDERMGSHIEIKGQGCRELESLGVVVGWAEFIAKCLEWGAKVSRLDLYIDCRDGSVTVDECAQKWKEGQVVSRASEGGTYEGMRRGEGCESGKTLLIGRRVSDTFVRIYDKRLQQCPKELRGSEREGWLEECGPWVRVEVELKDDRAKFAARVIAERGFGWGLIASFINSHVEFKEGVAEGHNASRVPTWEPWARLMRSAEKIRLAKGVMQRSLAQSERNLEKMWGPTILTIIASKEGDIEWLRGLALRSKDRVREKHRRMLAEADRAAMQWEVA